MWRHFGEAVATLLWPVVIVAPQQLLLIDDTGNSKFLSLPVCDKVTSIRFQQLREMIYISVGQCTMEQYIRQCVTYYFQ